MNDHGEERLRWGAGTSALGRVVVVAGGGGVRSVFFGDEDPHLSCPGASLERDRELDMLASVITDEPAVALDMRGTEFQQQVWGKLLEIPRGDTWTYTQLAASLGRPRAVRAVGAACAQNRIGVLIPCHRVVRTDGSLAGYRWGLERKRALLEAEGAIEE